MSNEPNNPTPPTPTPNAGEPPKAPAGTPPAPVPPPAPAPNADDAPGQKPDIIAERDRERDKRQKLEKAIADSLGIELSSGGKDSHYDQIASKLAPLAKLADALGQGDPAAKAKDPVELLDQRLSTHEKELAEERSARWRAEIAHEKGLTPQQAGRLQGSTRDELTKDADALLALFPAGQQPKKFGSGDGGARPGATQPGQLTRDDVKRMSPAEIVKAKAEGRLNDLMSGTTT